jgi:hypothetical protein
MSYAVVKDYKSDVCKRQMPYSFTVWHESEKLAREEALRLCMKEGGDFIVLKTVVHIKTRNVPVVFEEIQ